MYILQPLPITALILSLMFAYYDWKTREAPLWLILTAGAIGLGICISAKREFISVLYALIPGILMILLSFATEGKLGIGDGIFVSILALFMEWKQVCIMTGVAFFLAGVLSLGMIAVAQIHGYCVRERKLPFLCFMPLGVILAFLAEI